MDKFWIVLFVCIGLIGSTSYAEDTESIDQIGTIDESTVDNAEAVAVAEPETDPAVPRSSHLPVAVVAFGDVDDALVDRAQKWAEQNLAIPVPLLKSEPGAQLATFEEVTAMAASMLETNRIGLVVLWRPTSDISNHGAHYPDKRVAVANLNPMFTPDTDAEKIERRVERQVIRGVCLLMGLEPSPNPYSAMFNYANLEELDTISRNLDPPWLKRLQEKAVEMGIPVEQENVFNMTN